MALPPNDSSIHYFNKITNTFLEKVFSSLKITTDVITSKGDGNHPMQKRFAPTVPYLKGFSA
jgi:hypothetical protein